MPARKLYQTHDIIQGGPRLKACGDDVVDVLIPSKRKYLTHDIIQGGPRLKACGDDVVDVFIVAEVAIMPMLRGAEQTYQSLRLSLPLPAL